jgi:hypothetical protein
MEMTVRAAVVIAVLAIAGVARAQPATPVLREANDAAIAGDWDKVARLVQPIADGSYTTADLAEAHRLAGLAAFFQHREQAAEAHFLLYLRLDLDARLDPALVPPEAITFFEDVRTRHGAELRALRPRPKTRRYFVLELLPPFGQIQNGQSTKAWLIGGGLVAAAAANVTSYALLKSWCSELDKTCGSHTHSAETMQAINVVSGLLLIATYAFGVYDGVVVYRQQRPVPYLLPAPGGGIAGLAGRF